MKDKKQRDESKIEIALEYGNNIIATLREPFLVLDKNLRVISANQIFYTTFVVVEKDTIGRLLPDLGDGQWNIPKLLALLKEIIPEKKAVKDYEVEHKFEQIGERVMCLNARQMRVPKEIAVIIKTGVREEEEEEEEEELILLAIEDITERKRLQEELKESEERFRRAFETSQNALLLVHKTEGRVLNSNASAQELLDYSHEELLKKKLWEIGAIKDAKDFQEMMLRLEKDGLIHYEDTLVKTKKGQNINSDVFLVNRAKVLQCNIRDISERKEMEEKLANAYAELENKVRERTNKLQQSEEKISACLLYTRSVLEASLDPLVTISQEGKITDLNEATIKVTGISREKLIGTEFSGYFTEPEKAREGYQQAFAKGFISDYPLTIRHKDGKLTDVLYNATVYKEDRGNILGVVAAARDVTELKKTEQMAKEMQRALIQSEKLVALGKLAGSVSHELRNPLGVIRNSIYFLKMKLGQALEDEKIKRHLDILEEEIEISDRIINDILAFARIKEARLAETDINGIIEAILKDIKTPENIRITSQLNSDLPHISADEVQLKQAFSNIMLNAVQAMPNGGELSIANRTNNENIEVDIIDTGTGIAKENLDKIFDPLFSTKAQGTGLGLTVCKSIIEMHSGSIEVESEMGKGTKFIVKLPIKSQNVRIN